MALFEGSGVALITPFTPSGIDFDRFEKQIEFQIQNGTDALIVVGTTGEAATMTPQEKDAAIGFVIETARKRVPVIAGTGGNDTARAADASRRARELGADALLVVTPYYNKTTPQGLFAHYSAIDEAAGLPIIVYNVPGRTGMNITPQTLLALSKIPGVTGMKEASGDIKQIVEMTRLCGDTLDFYSGNDDHILPLLAIGFKGVISVVANVAPRDTRELCALYRAGDIAAARAMQYRLNPLVECLFSEVSPIPTKAALRLMGMDSGILRLPLVPMQPANEEKLVRCMAALGLPVSGT